MSDNKKKTSKLKAILAWLHLWLGLISGVVVVIVSITGCIMAFEDEIRSVTQPYLFVQNSSGAKALPPSELIAIAKKELKDKEPTGFTIPAPGRSAIVNSFKRKPRSFHQVYINQYTGAVLKVKSEDDDFFRFILEGHFNLWLPRDIGQPIVSYATVMFVIILITGLVLWWPKNWKKSNVNKSFKIKWSAKLKRLNYDLHNVLGFYALVIALVIALTGMTFGLKWFTNSLYWTFSGGQSFTRIDPPKSDTTLANSSAVTILDVLWEKHQLQSPKDGLSINIPSKASDIFIVNVNHSPGKFSNTDNYYYDQFTGREFKGKELFDGRLSQVRLSRQIHLYSYDIHVGSIIGLPGKILAFLASLISATLPITGFIIWWGKNKKKKKTEKKENYKKKKSKENVVVHEEAVMS